MKRLKKIIIESGYKKDEPIIFVSPAPFIGYPWVESGQLDAIEGTKITKIVGKLPFGRYWYDMETWKANPEEYYNFFDFLLNEIYSQDIVVLSGDVHYGFTGFSTFSGKTSRKQKLLYQFTSSALKNSPTDLNSWLVSQLQKRTGESPIINFSFPKLKNNKGEAIDVKGGIMRHSGDSPTSDHIPISVKSNIGYLEFDETKWKVNKLIFPMSSSNFSSNYVENSILKK